MKKKICFALCTTLFGSAAAHAADAGSFYEGIGIGSVSYDLHLTDAERHLPFKGPDGQSISQDTYGYHTGTQAVQLFGGYRFNRYIALELSLEDLGAVDRDGTFNVTNGGPLNGTLVSHTSIEPRGVGLSVLGIWPINESVDVYGRLGVFDWSIKAPYTVTSNGEPFLRDQSKDHGSDPFVGIGGAYKWGIFSVRMEYQHYRFSKPFMDTHDAVADVFSASFLYNF